MPLYDYRCRKCGETFEVKQKFSDPLLTEHEGCGGPVERLISTPALQFKGTGWYITDYARGGAGNGKSESKPKSDAPTSETKSESKPDTPKSESKPSSPSPASDK
jgi:putative FmdB family regulatory protein